MLQSATIHQQQIIGEASNYFSNEFFKKYDYVEWTEIVGLRNLLIHEYFGIDLLIVWQIIQNDLPPLKKDISEILKNFSA